MLTNICQSQSQTSAMSNKDLKNTQKKNKGKRTRKVTQLFCFPIDERMTKSLELGGYYNRFYDSLITLKRVKKS